MLDRLARFQVDGFVMLDGVYSAHECEEAAYQLGELLHDERADSALRAHGGVYGARNLLQLWPAVAEFWQRPPLVEALQAILGPRFGLTRVLYFDKPPGLSWSLPWHKDLTIAVKEHRLPGEGFKKPTTKAGIPHVEAPEALLQEMVNARIHLDDISAENGPMCVLPGSHRDGKRMPDRFETVTPICACGGDVLLIRPLVAHCSRESQPETPRHRRILHLEFAASPALPHGYGWHDFVPAATMAKQR
jgi:hypothetical protein